jgi:beta-1,4-N-acetylglucosaminyltransferase
LSSVQEAAEILNILTSISDLHLAYTQRTYVCSSGDSFSASKAAEFEKTLGGQCNIVTVHRARRVHQPLLTAPFTTLQCLYDCVVLLHTQPDLILTNGPGTGVCIVLAAIIRLFLGGDGMRTIFIESWARVKTLSLSGKILKPFVDRFIVQWPDLVRSEGDRVEYLGPLVS